LNTILISLILILTFFLNKLSFISRNLVILVLSVNLNFTMIHSIIVKNR